MLAVVAKTSLSIVLKAHIEGIHTVSGGSENSIRHRIQPRSVASSPSSPTILEVFPTILDGAPITLKKVVSDGSLERGDFDGTLTVVAAPSMPQKDPLLKPECRFEPQRSLFQHGQKL